jgi:hypothetical protein
LATLSERNWPSILIEIGHLAKWTLRSFSIENMGTVYGDSGKRLTLVNRHRHTVFGLYKSTKREYIDAKCEVNHAQNTRNIASFLEL